jgi:hypothetical protein
MIQWSKKFWNEARDKLTTYVGLLIASAAEIKDNWPDIVNNLPKWPAVIWLERHAFALLGLLVVYTRVRRAMRNVQ